MVLLVSAIAAGCRANATPQPTVQTSPGSAVVQRQAAPDAARNVDSDLSPARLPQETPTPHVLRVAGENLLITTIEVPRHGIDLPTFLSATAAEMEADARIRITSLRVDGELRADGIPVGVISFTAYQTDEPASIGGRQYAIALPDGENFLAVTCAAALHEAEKCDDAVRSLDLDAGPAMQ